MSVCLFVCALNGKWLELSAPNLVHLYSIALTHRSKGQGHTVTKTVTVARLLVMSAAAVVYCCCQHGSACRYDCLCLFIITTVIAVTIIIIIVTMLADVMWLKLRQRVVEFCCCCILLGCWCRCCSLSTWSMPLCFCLSPSWDVLALHLIRTRLLAVLPSPQS